MLDRACDALNGLSAERQMTVEFMARLGTVGADFMQQADMQDAVEQDALQSARSLTADEKEPDTCALSSLQTNRCR